MKKLIVLMTIFFNYESFAQRQGRLVMADSDGLNRLNRKVNRMRQNDPVIRDRQIERRATRRLGLVNSDLNKLNSSRIKKMSFNEVRKNRQTHSVLVHKKVGVTKREKAKKITKNHKKLSHHKRLRKRDLHRNKSGIRRVRPILRRRLN